MNRKGAKGRVQCSKLKVESRAAATRSKLKAKPKAERVPLSSKETIYDNVSELFDMIFSVETMAFLLRSSILHHTGNVCILIGFDDRLKVEIHHSDPGLECHPCSLIARVYQNPFRYDFPLQHQR